jgi:hypothetical protein
MKIPFLIFLVSGFATLQLEPAFTQVAQWASRYAASESAPPLLKAGDRKVIWLKEELAEVQMDLLNVLQANRDTTNHDTTNHDTTGQLESREAGLKYALRAEQLRQDEVAQALRQQQKASRFPLRAAQRLVFELRMPRL